MAGQLRRRQTGMRPWWRESPVADMRREMDDVFSRFFGGESGATGSGMSPNIDVSETDQEIEVCMDLPGFKPDEINVDLNQDVLTISGSHQEEKEEKEDGRRYHRIERHRGSFHRSLQLPAMVKSEDIDATFKDGVLTVRLPKSEESQSRKIAVKGAEG